MSRARKGRPVRSYIEIAQAQHVIVIDSVEPPLRDCQASRADSGTATKPPSGRVAGSC